MRHANTETAPCSFRTFANDVALTRIKTSRVTKMNLKQRELILAVMEMISGTCENMEEDPFHAPAKWLLENWWATLNAALQVRDH